MMAPPPALRISGTAYLHIRNAPVRLTASASFQSSSVSVSTVPSGVTLAATLTRVVSLPKASTACRTDCFGVLRAATFACTAIA